jgi:anti-sigma factor RsiW
MNCQELVDFLMDYLDGALPAEQAASFKEHLNRCPPCVMYLQSYEQCIRIGKECMCEDEQTMAVVPESMVQAILNARKQA